MSYGYELILDLFECDVAAFNRESIDGYFAAICEAIEMEKCERYWWDDVGVDPEEQQDDPDTTGTSAVQFILTSSIVIHTLDMRRQAFVNIFSCKTFDRLIAYKVTQEWFRAQAVGQRFIERG